MGVIQSLWKKFFEPSHVNRAEAPSHASKQPVADEAETLRSYDAKRPERNRPGSQRREAAEHDPTRAP